MTPLEASAALEATTAPAPETGEAVASIPTGSLSLDSVLALRGWPIGQVSQVQGDAAVGKTTLLYQTIAQAQKAGLTVAFFDFRAEFNPTYAAALGVSLAGLLVCQPMREALHFLNRYPGDVLVFDGIDDQGAADQVGTSTPGRTVIAATNIRYTWRSGRPAHVGDVIAPEIPYSAARVSLRAGKPVLGGIHVNVQVLKDAYALPGRVRPEATYKIRHGQGIDTCEELLDFGVEFGLIRKSGTWYFFGEWSIQSASGHQRAAQYLAQRPDLQEKLQHEIRARLDSTRVNFVE